MVISGGGETELVVIVRVLMEDRLFVRNLVPWRDLRIVRD